MTFETKNVCFQSEPNYSLCSGNLISVLNPRSPSFFPRCMSIPITMRAIRKKVSSLTTRPVPVPDPELSTAMEITSTPRSVSHEAVQEERMASSPPGYYLMSVSSPVADNANTDAVANPSPCASLAVYSHWVTSGLPAELL